MSTEALVEAEIVYPESDGKPMADNTLQWEWMVKVVGELRTESDREFLAEGSSDGLTLRLFSADGRVEIVFQLGSAYPDQETWERHFRDHYRRGVSEFYILEPERPRWSGFTRRQGYLITIHFPGRFVSPYFGVQFRYSTTGKFAAYSPPRLAYDSTWVRYHDTVSWEVREDGDG
jgi:hypothetical protein